jgi:hypothetical protein
MIYRLLKVKSLFLGNVGSCENSSSMTSQPLKLKALCLRKLGYATQRNILRRLEPS